MVDDAVLENESAHARPLAQVRGPIDSSAKYVQVVGRKGLNPGAGWLQRIFAAIVVFDASVAELLLGTEAKAKVGIEVAAK